VARVVAAADVRLAEGAKALAERAPADARGLVARWLSPAERRAEGVDEVVATLVMTRALKPWLRALAGVALATPAARSYSGRTCPACGGAPDFAALEGVGGERRLLCSRCDCEWSFARTGCPFCAEVSPKKLAYFAYGRYRLYVCDSCTGYLKTVDRRETWGDVPLAVERVLAVGLDVAATRAGYGPGAKN
jgi:FdhE protein